MSDLPDHSTPDVADLDGYYDKFYVHDAGELRHHLQRLVGERSALSVRTEGAQSELPTMLLKVEATTFLIDVPSTRMLLDAWLGAHQLRFEGSIDRAALRFGCGPARLDVFEDKPALRLPMPDRMLYLQRREFMRREPPMGALLCRLRLVEDEKEREIDASIRDIGGGGLAVIATRSVVALKVGDVLSGCRIELPDIGEVEVNLQVRHVMARGHLGFDMTQAGCEFVELAPAVQRKLFRYLLQLDRDLLAKRRRAE